MKKLLVIAFLTLSSSLLTIHAQSWLWGKQGKASTNVGDEGNSIARDKSGNVYITGWFKDTLILGADTLKTNVFNSTDVFLAKYDMNGNVLWARQSTLNSGISTGLSYSVTTDKTGNVYITGTFDKTINFGSNTLIQPYTNNDVFLVKYDPLGNVVWAKQSICRNSAFGTGYSVATDKMNNIILTGGFTDSITFGSHKLGCNNYNVFIAKFDSNGNTLWASAPTNKSSFITTAYSVAVDSAGSAYITGTFDDTLHFGIITLKANGNHEYFLVKYDSSGNVKWAQQSTNSSEARGNAVTMDAAGYLYTTGYYNGSSVFGPFHLPASASNDIFLAKYNASGSIIWIKNASNSSGTGFALTTDKNYNAYLSGAANSNIIFGNDTFKISTGTDPLILAKFDSSGNCLCGSIIASGGDDFSGIVTDLTGNYVYLGGDLEDTVTFGADKIGPAAYTGTEWMFLAKWQPCSSNNEGVNNVISSKSSVVLFPNPNNGQFTLEVKREVPIAIGIRTKSAVEVYNMLGQIIYSTSLSINNSTFNINLGSQPNGVYLYRVLTETGSLVSDGKFIIQK
jgi:hypothetical protein